MHTHEPQQKPLYSSISPPDLLREKHPNSSRQNDGGDVTLHEAYSIPLSDANAKHLVQPYSECLKFANLHSKEM